MFRRGCSVWRKRNIPGFILYNILKWSRPSLNRGKTSERYTNKKNISALYLCRYAEYCWLPSSSKPQLAQPHHNRTDSISASYYSKKNMPKHIYTDQLTVFTTNWDFSSLRGTREPPLPSWLIASNCHHPTTLFHKETHTQRHTVSMARQLTM